MPLSKIPPTISLHPTDTPLSTTPQDHLTTSPPELLLAILSHLPPSTLYPLSRTSKYIHTFLLTHAATICNTAIQSTYSLASTILHSQHSSTGWLIPTHPAILNEERRLVRDKILFSGCKCPPCRQVLHSSSSTDLSVSELDEIHGLGALNCLNGLRSQSCKARKEIDSCLKLSKPGPQYLVFLEKYSWEIVTRHSMSSFSNSNSNSNSNETAGSQDSTAVPSPTSTSNGENQGNAEIEQDAGGEEEREREKEEAMFEFMVGNYCVRRFLESAEKVLSSLPSPTSNPAPPSPRFSPIIDQGRKLRRKLLRNRMVKRQRIEVSEVAEVVEDRVVDGRQSNPASPSPTPRRMMFGEISPSTSDPNNDEKALLVQQKKVVGERWEDGLLWYHGLQGLGSDPEEAKDEQNGMEGKERRRGCMAVLKKGLGIISRRVRTLFMGRCVGLRKLRVGGFRALEG
ncbi:hypothetical protein F5882DRAFT_399958 [Hyaloscypha sp. PMI_1271]|nr:hypothetical protein F5882DRAFT_399958 [Hyaloscypha sp. PMI_1271]